MERNQNDRIRENIKKALAGAGIIRVEDGLMVLQEDDRYIIDITIKIERWIKGD
jgi:hypothetical protein